MEIPVSLEKNFSSILPANAVDWNSKVSIEIKVKSIFLFL